MNQTKECKERKKKSLSFPPPREFQIPISSGTPRLLINLPRNLLSHCEGIHLFPHGFPWRGVRGDEKTRKNCNSRQPDLTVVDQGCVCVYVCVCVCVLSCLSCLTLCNPMDYSPPGSSVHGDSPGKNTGVGGHALLLGIFPTQELNLHFLCLLHWLVGLYH